jgi:ligand-binding sensor domain-containing protein
MRYLILIVQSLLSVIALCQDPSFRPITVKDGLPGSIIYQTLQDKSGFIWIATNQGISRYDGRSFTSFTKEDGLPDNEIIKLYCDRHNNIWAISFLGIPSVFCKGVIRRFDNCTGVRHICEDFLTDSIFLIAGQWKGDNEYPGYYSASDNRGNWQFAAHFNPLHHPAYATGPLLRLSSPGKINFSFSVIDSNNLTLTLKSILSEKSYPVKRKDLQDINSFDLRNFCCLTARGDGIIFNTAEYIYYADFNKLYRVCPLGKLNRGAPGLYITSFFCENDTTLWICTQNQGLFRVTNFLSPHFTIHSFWNKTYCTSITKDLENGYWVSTYNNGIYYLPNLSFRYISTLPGIAEENILCIKNIHSSKMLAGTVDGKIIEINAAGLTGNYFPGWAARNVNNRVLDICQVKNNSFLVNCDAHLRFFPSGKNSGIGEPVAIKAIYKQPDNTIVVGSCTGVSLWAIKGKLVKTIYPKRVTCVAVQNKHYYWGTLHGMYSCLDGVVNDAYQKNACLAGIINHIDISPDSTLWVSTPDGIVLFKDSVRQLIRKENGLPSNMCRQISFDKNTAWVATDKGIARIDYNMVKNTFKYSIAAITEEDGLTTSDVNQTTVAGDYVWAATARGVSVFEKSYIGGSAQYPLVNINKIVVGHNSVPMADTILVTSKDKLLVELAGISYRSGRLVNYEYRLKGFEFNWNKISNNVIELTSLPFGQLVFEARAIDRWGKRSNSKFIIIINRPPFWNTTWFLIVTYVAIAGLVGLGFFLFNRGRQRKQQQEFRQKKKIQDLESMALRAQMDPHFIFNCLNSIHYHIIRADARNANLYLQKLSTLIRQTLQNSTSPIVTLHEEVRTLELYLDLEKFRLEERMEYQLTVSSEASLANPQIPAMIIQPFIENAIKHGIAPLENRKGMLTINIYRSGDYINCTIEDNGPGPFTSVQHHSYETNDYKPMGTQITANRIKSMNAIQQKKYDLI